jgi:hypothetical protein
VSGRIPKKLRPRTLRQEEALQTAALERGLIVVRGLTPGRAIFYHLVRTATIRPRWPLADEVEHVVARELVSNMRRRLAMAIKGTSAVPFAGSVVNRTGRAR